ncbi:sirohydrochlorin chelatase [Sporolactobacillus inulinus]|uniref:Ferrochelatase n=1 Tax=Sporolactobacillus inulinus CASD TaxID=1069536 RepID=A0A0U1QNR4_9BACL|nr:sirohydrochlorin chelatase [Sporolactobacillus inulinus]KLI02434.1 ferrochelatase [Sporolactobacillus inulinus CASD]GEB76826.1 sirohydrochlorin ferrochelatase [Sporolactobacillus inulinus]
MLAVLYVSHGTRIHEGVKQANQFLSSCMKQVDAPIQRVCYLEIVQPGILDGIRQCIAAGAEVVLVQPLLLLTAGHAKRDIPRVIKQAEHLYPDVRFIYGRPFGVDERIVSLLIERLHEQQDPLPQGSAILLVGRGSSDPDTKRNFAQIRHLLHQKGMESVTLCYMAAAKPTFDEGLDQVIREQWRHVYVIPYLLFSGVLMKTIYRSIDVKNKAGASITLCRPLGYHPNLIQLMKKRVEESLHHVLSDYA